MTKRFELIDDLTSDVLFVAYGNTLSELFENAAVALFSIICDIKKVKPVKELKLELYADNSEELLYDWLSALLAESEIREMFFSEFDADTDGKHLKAVVKGMSANPKLGNVQVKAITMYRFGIEKLHNKYKATVSCDI